MKDALFLIEGGKPLEMVKAYITDVIRIRQENTALAKELGVDSIFTSRTTGALAGVNFPGAIHPDFAKPKKRNGASYPKRGTDWAKRLAALQGTPNAATLIAAAFGIPCSLSYTTEDGEGWRCLGNPLTECGFLYLSKDGPYAMWAPDVPAVVQEAKASGQTVTGAAATFVFDIPGARRILTEEWELMVAQKTLSDKLATNAAEASATA